MSDELWVGFDVGTQSVRAMAVSATGDVAGSGARPLRSRRDGDHHEQDPQDWWEALAGACREALHGIAPERVAGAATCATSGTILLLDSAGAPATPALMYDDARVAGSGPAKLRPLLEHPAAQARGARLAHACDVVTRRLAGDDVATDWSHALKSGYDPQAERWHPDSDSAAELLPDVVRPGTQLGVVSEEAARETGLAAGTAVVAGMTDGCAAQLAAGALRDGDWNSVLGTTLVLKGASAQRVEDSEGVLYCHRSPDGGWLPGGASNAGAGVLAERFADRDLDALGQRAQAHEHDAPLAYPLVGRGERFPFRAPQAHAFMLGEPGGDAEELAALLQGLAFVQRLCLDRVALLGAPADGEVSLTGGATRSALLCRLIADVLDRPVRLPEQSESAFGMAVLAAAATRGRSCAQTAAEMCRTREVVEPRPDATRRSRDGYLRFVDELERREWLGPRLARHARESAG